MDLDVAEEPRGFLSTELADLRVVRTGWALALISVLVFLAAVPFARVPSIQAPVFVPIYVSCLVVFDLITAILLFSQFRFVRSTSLLILAGGYLFTASATAAYALIFPGLFAPTGLFDSGPQTSSAMYMFWHAGFPLIAIVYSLFKGREMARKAMTDTFRGKAWLGILATVVIVAAIVVAFMALATVGQAFVPEFLAGNRTTFIGHVFLTGIWLLSLAALIVMSLRRPRTVLDVWVMVVMTVWLFDLALSALLNTGRYDLGWYIGRIYGLLAASFLLILLLVENGLHYGRLFQLTVELNLANGSLKKLSLHDGMTELANRRYFDTYLAEQVAVSRRYRRPLALVMLDVDHFKAYNDQYGHQPGDDSLKQVAAVMTACCQRPADMAARYGGEEFALILPDTDSAGARKIAEAVRRGVEQLRIPHASSSAGTVLTISAGLAVCFGTDELSPGELIAEADQSLYRAKQTGRNRVAGEEKLEQQRESS